MMENTVTELSKKIKEEDRINTLSVKFRDAILKCDRSDMPPSLMDFPYGSCADASRLLGTYLVDHGITGFNLVKGSRGEGDSIETHYWLEDDKLIVDITAEQFDDYFTKNLVSSHDSEWHKSFNKETKKVADYRVVGAKDVRKHLEAVYEYIIEFCR